MWTAIIYLPKGPEKVDLRISPKGKMSEDPGYLSFYSTILREFDFSSMLISSWFQGDCWPAIFSHLYFRQEEGGRREAACVFLLEK